MSDPALIDTNVLVYATDPAVPQHADAESLCNRALAGDVEACVTPQVLLEFFATVTNPKRVANPRTPAVAWGEVAKFRAALPVLATPIDLVDRVRSLAEPLGIRAQDIFDVQIAATMLAQAQPVTRIYTYDPAVFGRVPGITVLTP